MFPKKEMGDVRKLTPYFAREMDEGCEKQKIKLQGSARDARTRETRAYFSSSDEQKMIEKVKNRALRKTPVITLRATGSGEKAVVHPWRNGQMFSRCSMAAHYA